MLINIEQSFCAHAIVSANDIMVVEYILYHHQKIILNL